MCPPAKVATLEALIDSLSYETDYDDLACVVPLAAYFVLGDRVFDWLLDMALARTAADKQPNYYLVLSRIGHDSDGFSADFIERAYSLISDPAAPLEARQSCAWGTLEWHAFYRPQRVYQVMEAIGQFVLTQPTLSSAEYPFHGKGGLAGNCLRRLVRRANALGDLREGRLLIDSALGAQAASEKTELGRKFADYGYDFADLQFLPKLVATILAWGFHAGRKAPDGSELTAAHLRSPHALRWADVRVHWRVGNPEQRLVTGLEFQPSKGFGDGGQGDWWRDWWLAWRMRKGD